MNPENIEKTNSGHVLSCPAPVKTQPSGNLLPASPEAVPAVPPNGNFPPAEKNSAFEKFDASDDPHIRAGSLLARLTPDQRTQLFKWLLEFSVSDVLNFVAAPPPHGLGIQTHKTTLRRIKGMIRGHDACAKFETSATTAEYLAETIRENRPPFAPMISELLLQKAFDLASNPSQNHELRDLINSAIKLRELDLKVQRLQLLSEKAASNPTRRRVHVKSSPPLPVAPEKEK
jgi:hypothetical protein